MATVEAYRELPPPGLQGALVPVTSINPSQTERGFFYDEQTESVPTSVYTGIGRVAGMNLAVEYTFEGPETGGQDTPLLIFNGLAGTEGAYDEFRSEVAQRGKPAISVRPVRGDYHLGHMLHPQKLASKAGLGVMRDVTAEAGYEKYDVWAHSFGGQPATELAIHRPELVRTVTLASAVGLDDHNLPKMIERLGDFARKDFLPSLGKLATMPSFIRDEVEYFGRNPALTLAEALSAGSCSLHERVQRVRELGIPVGAILYARDDFHPAEAVVRHSSHLFDARHIYRDPEARHTSPQTDPSGNAAAYFEVVGKLEKRLRVSS